MSGYYTCLPPCSGSERIVFASVDTTEDEADRLPRSAAVVLSPGSPEIAQTIQLPVHGHALHYPFDSYELVLGVSVQRVSETGAPVALTPAEVANHVRLTVREALANFEMPAPERSRRRASTRRDCRTTICTACGCRSRARSQCN